MARHHRLVDPLGVDTPYPRIEHACEQMQAPQEAFHGPAIQEIRWIEGNKHAWFACVAWGSIQYATAIQYCPFCGVRLEPLDVPVSPARA